MFHFLEHEDETEDDVTRERRGQGVMACDVYISIPSGRRNYLDSIGVHTSEEDACMAFRSSFHTGDK